MHLVIALISVLLTLSCSARAAGACERLVPVQGPFEGSHNAQEHRYNEAASRILFGHEKLARLLQMVAMEPNAPEQAVYVVDERQNDASGLHKYAVVHVRATKSILREVYRIG